MGVTSESKTRYKDSSGKEGKRMHQPHHRVLNIILKNDSFISIQIEFRLFLSDAETESLDLSLKDIKGMSMYI